MSALHTPGPWEVKQSYSSERIAVVAPQPTDRVLAAFGSEDEPLDDTDVCNARLIAAAPDLLAALRDAHALLVAIQVSPHHRRDVAEQARAAIAKATGET